MLNKSKIQAVLATAAVLAIGASARASVTAVVDQSGNAPATTLGPYTMTPFAKDTLNAADSLAPSVPAPGGTTVGLSPSMIHTTVGDEWSFWNSNYSGDVYFLAAPSYVQGNAAAASAPTPDISDVTLTLPADTTAFYLYAEPAFQNSSMTITGSDGSSNASQPTTVDWDGGASYFGFYATNPGEYLTTITVHNGQPYGFAIGEFGIATAVPEPASLSCLGIAAVGLLGRRRSRSTN